MSSDDKTRFLPELAKATVGLQLSGIYELDEHLASGGMGEVYRGHNIQTGDPVAIKIVLPEFARDQTILSLFRKEASILNHLSHEAIVRYHVFTIDPAIGRPYLAMEFVDGESLFDVMRRGPMAMNDVLKLCMRVASGLAAVHEANTFHRDLSPDNIILPGGRVERAKIIDFGIARSTKVGEGTLIGGRFAGKYNYVSPEQLGLFGGEVSEQSDIYSLGLVLAAVLRAAPLDMSGSQWEVVEKRQSLPDLSGIDERFRPILEAMLQPDPKDRPASMTEIVERARARLAPDGPGTAPPKTAATVGDAEMRENGRQPVAPLSDASGLAGSKPSESWNPYGSQAEQPRFVPHVTPAILAQAHSPAAKTVTAPKAPKRRMLLAGSAAAAVMLVVGAFYMGPLGLSPRPTPPDEVPQISADDASDDLAEAPAAVAAETVAPAEEAAETAVMEVVPQPPAEEISRPDALPNAFDEADRQEPQSVGETRPPGHIQEARLPDEPPPTEAIDEVARRIAWLDGYSGGDCFYATATSATDTAIDIEGFGSAVAPFNDLLDAFEAEFGIEPEVSVRLIDPAQCAVTEFLRSLSATVAEAPQLMLDRTSVPDGSSVSGALEMPTGRASNLLLVDHKGMVFNLDSRVSVQSDRGSFSIPIGLSAADKAAGRIVPQVIIALAAPSGIEAAAFARPLPASRVLPDILEEIRRKGLESSATAKYFRLGG